MPTNWKRLTGGVAALLLCAAMVPGLLPVIRVLVAAMYVVLAIRLGLTERRTEVRTGRAAPFALAAVGIVVSAAGALVRIGLRETGVGNLSFASAAFGFLGYGFLILAGLVLVRARTREHRWDEAIDAALVGVVTFTTLFCFVVESYLFRVEETLDTRLANAGFAVAITVVVMVAARVAFGPGRRNGSYHMVAGATGFIVVNEVVLQLEAAGQAGIGRLSDVFGPLAMVCMIGAVSHPGVLALADLPEQADERFGRARQVFNGFCLFHAIGLVGWTAAGGHETSLLVAGIGAVLVVTLTIVRTRQIVVDRQRALRTEQRLRRFTSSEDRPVTLDEADAAARRLAVDLLPPRGRHLVQIGVGTTLREAVGRLDVSPDLLELLFRDVGGFDRHVSSGRVGPRSFVVEGMSGGTARDSALLSVAPARTAGCSVILVEASTILSRRSRAAMEALVAQLALVRDHIASLEREHQRRADDRFRALVQDASDIVCVVNPETMLTEVMSPTIDRLLGYPVQDALGISPFGRLHPDEQDDVEAIVIQSVNRGDVPELDVRVRHSEGHYLWFSLSVRDLGADEEVTGWLFSFADIHDRKMAELQLSSAEARYRALVTNSNDVMVLVRADRLVYVSPNVERVFGFRPGEMIGARVDAFLPLEDNPEIDRLFSDGRLVRSGAVVNVELTASSGELRRAELTFADPALDHNQVMITVRDITARYELEASLRDRVLHDSLTGLFNRASVHPELQRLLQGLDQDAAVAVLYLDVRNFREVNDSLGVAVGDALLIEIATRLRSALRTNDVIARLNGDEFAILTVQPCLAEAHTFAERILELFQQPFDVDGRLIETSAVVGLTTTVDRMANATSLVESAGIALRHAKAEHRDIVSFETWMRDAASERYELASALRSGLANDEFFVVYQPLFQLGSHRVSSCEALLRWQHPKRGFVSPGLFIPLAESSGAIIDLGRWVLSQACEQLAHWHENLPGGQGLSMSVNVSARQLDAAGEAEVLRSVIVDSGVDPSRLILELTESVMLDELGTIGQHLADFRELGVRIAVDDFGTGAAGIGHLRDVPFDILKIDKSYVDGLSRSSEAQNLISGVIELAHGLGATVVAEGIETPIQAELLRAMKCDYGQGFYLGRPMGPEHLESWFADGRSGVIASAIAEPTPHIRGADTQESDR